MKKLSIFSLALAAFALAAQNPTSAVITTFVWHYHAGWETNKAISFNVRHWDGIMSISEPLNWPLVTNVVATNVTLLIDPSALFGISVYDNQTRTESMEALSPVGRIARDLNVTPAEEQRLLHLMMPDFQVPLREH